MRANIIKKSILFFFAIIVILGVYVSYYVGLSEVFHDKAPQRQDSAILYSHKRISDLETYYLELGEASQPVIIFLHGWAGKYNQDSSRQIITAFSESGYRAIALEQPGMGRTQTPSDSWSNEKYADFVKSFIDELGIDKVTLVGQSFGGAVAARFAEKYPEKLENLVLVNAASNDKSDMQKKLVNLLGNAFPVFVKSSIVPEGIQNLAAKYMLRLPVDFNNAQEKEDRAEIMGKTFILTHSEDILDRLKNIETNTLLVWGSSDKKIPLSNAKMMLEELPSAKLVELEGGHTVIYDRPKAAADLIIENLY